MLLLLTLTLRGAITITPMPPTPEGGGTFYERSNEKELIEKRNKIILRDDDEVLAIIKIWMKNYN